MSTISNSLRVGEDGFIWPTVSESAGNHAPQYDYELARRVSLGDIPAFEELYLRHQRRVYSLCLRMTNNIPEAEDLTQEVFIHLFHKIGSFRGDSAFTTWLHRLTVNKVLMYLSTNKKYRSQKTLEDLMHEPEARQTFDDNRTLTWDRLTLERAVMQLPPGYRAVFILHDVEGYEHSEVARICEISVGTTKSQLHKARRKL
ncbi:MAG: polymerase sigma-70 factor, subfamily, partial [Acidobacteriaceae bacterium]|nr:polymerase sigma-70 factor, subfamily [Acidobacteriaceae bacterium]